MKHFNVLKWAINNLPLTKIEKMFVAAQNFEQFLDNVRNEAEAYRNLKNKRASQQLVQSAAYDKILKIKESGKKIKAYKRRTKSTKARILEHFAEITALRNGGSYDGKLIPKCSWYEILLFLKQKGIHTTEQYLRHTYTAELVELNKKHQEMLK